MRVCAYSLLFVRLPTAQPSFAELASTAYSALSPAVPGLGLGTICQLVPSQRRVNVVWSRALPLEVLPTAHAFDGEMATTPLSTLSRLSGFGLGTMLQLLPFQCSMSVRFQVPKP